MLSSRPSLHISCLNLCLNFSAQGRPVNGDRNNIETGIMFRSCIRQDIGYQSILNIEKNNDYKMLSISLCMRLIRAVGIEQCIIATLLGKRWPRSRKSGIYPSGKKPILYPDSQPVFHGLLRWLPVQYGTPWSGGVALGSTFEPWIFWYGFFTPKPRGSYEPSVSMDLWFE